MTARAAPEAGFPPSGAEDLVALRSRVRRWCEDHVPSDWRRQLSGAGEEGYVAFQRWWLQELRGGGFAVPHWPAEWGGGASLAEQVVIHEELARADAPRLSLYFISLHHTPATLLAAGTEAQRRRHLPAILGGEVWCQGFSEPNAGSDLASLRTRAERDGDRYVVNGQKVWSSLALYADWCLLLVRTDPRVPKHQGISYLLLDLDRPGVEVRPIRDATGQAEFCELFLTDVEVPVEQRVGEENAGWCVAQATLAAERGPTVLELAERLRGAFDRLVGTARRSPGPDGRPAIEDEAVRECLATYATEVEIMRLLCNRMIANLVNRGGVGPEASIIKVYYSELQQRLTGFGVELEGPRAHDLVERPLGAGWDSGYWMLDFIGSWAWTIAGGSNEIQRTLIGERVLGLPKEPAGAGR